MGGQTVSVWATTLVIDDGEPEEGDLAPIVYQGSHVLPADTDERGGGVEIAHVPGRYNGWHPWLRLTVYDDTVGANATIVLTEPQVRLLHAALAEHLAGIGDTR